MNRRDFVGALATGLCTSAFPGANFASVHARRLPQKRADDHLVERWSWVMGQAVHVQLFAPTVDQGLAAAAAALAELRRIEGRLSIFDDASDLSELNRQAGRKSLRVGPDLRTVLAAAAGFTQITGGSFNPAVEPLMRTWGFRSFRSSEPTPAELEEAKRSVVAAEIVLRRDRVSLPCADTRLDLGGIGVGYGLDRAASILAAQGIQRAFIDVSGDCIALGAPPGEEGWLVEIAGQSGQHGPPVSTRLTYASLATSANTQSVVHYGRVVRGHVMNPETGWPADARRQVSVVAGSAIAADALSTAMLVSGRPAAGVLRYYGV